MAPLSTAVAVRFDLFMLDMTSVIFLSSVFLLTEFGSLTASQLMEKVRGLQNLAYQLGLEEGNFLQLVNIMFTSCLCTKKQRLSINSAQCHSVVLYCPAGDAFRPPAKYQIQMFACTQTDMHRRQSTQSQTHMLNFKKPTPL